MTKKEIIEAYTFLRTKNSTISNETLEFIKDLCLSVVGFENYYVLTTKPYLKEGYIKLPIMDKIGEPYYIAKFKNIERADEIAYSEATQFNKRLNMRIEKFNDKKIECLDSNEKFNGYKVNGRFWYILDNPQWLIDLKLI